MTTGKIILIIGAIAACGALFLQVKKDCARCEGPKEKRFVIISTVVLVLIAAILLILKANIGIFLLVFYVGIKFIEGKRLDIRRFKEH